MHQMCACLTNIYMYYIHIQVRIYKKHILCAHLYTRSTAAPKKLEDRAVGRLVDICSLLLGWCWPQLQWVDIDQCVTVLHHPELTCIWSTEKHLGNVIFELGQSTSNTERNVPPQSGREGTKGTGWVTGAQAKGHGGTGMTTESHKDISSRPRKTFISGFMLKRGGKERTNC